MAAAASAAFAKRAAEREEKMSDGLAGRPAGSNKSLSSVLASGQTIVGGMNQAGGNRYGMDKDGDGVVNFAELQDYYKLRSDAIKSAGPARPWTGANPQDTTPDMSRNLNTSAWSPGIMVGKAYTRGWNGNVVCTQGHAKRLDSSSPFLDDDKGSSSPGFLKAGPMARIMQRTKPLPSASAFDHGQTSWGAHRKYQPRGRSRMDGYQGQTRGDLYKLASADVFKDPMAC